MSSSTTGSDPVASASSTPGDGGGGGSGGGPPPLLSSQASLYLYTFLVTLILLLSVSAAIVVRSYMLRRNQRRLIEEAIRNGTYVPPPERRAKKSLGKKPQLADVYLGTWDDDGRSGEDEYSIHNEKWTSIMPVAVSSLLFPTPDPDPPTYGAQPAAESTAVAPNETTSQRRSWFSSHLRPSWTRSRPQEAPILPTSSVPPSNLPASPPSPSTSDATSSENAKEPPSPRAHVAVLIALPVPPSQRRPHGHRPQSGPAASSKLPAVVETEELPYLEFGIVETKILL